MCAVSGTHRPTCRDWRPRIRLMNGSRVSSCSPDRSGRQPTLWPSPSRSGGAADELGADPTPALQRLHHQVLTADAALAAPREVRQLAPRSPRRYHNSCPRLRAGLSVMPASVFSSKSCPPRQQNHYRRLNVRTRLCRSRQHRRQVGCGPSRRGCGSSPAGRACWRSWRPRCGRGRRRWCTRCPESGRLANSVDGAEHEPPGVFPAFVAGLRSGELCALGDAPAIAVFPAFVAGLRSGDTAGGSWITQQRLPGLRGRAP